MWGYLGLIVAFMLLALISSWALITSRAHVMVKVFLIAFVMWYGVALPYAISDIQGRPKKVSSKDDLPNKAWVASVLVREPNKITKAPGFIYFIVTEYKKDNESNLTINPTKAFTSNHVNGEPRMYSVPYSKELHKKVIKATRKKGTMSGGRMRLVKEGTGRGGRPGEKSKAKLEIEVLNPASGLTK